MGILRIDRFARTIAGYQLIKAVSRGRDPMRPAMLVVMTSLAALAPAGAAHAGEAALFQFEQQARQHCPGDTVVWVTPASGLYSFAGERWYGSTKHGAFVCRREGDQAGYRPSRQPVKDRSPVSQAALPLPTE
jgi:hypothetical protein